MPDEKKDSNKTLVVTSVIWGVVFGVLVIVMLIKIASGLNPSGENATAITVSTLAVAHARGINPTVLGSLPRDLVITVVLAVVGVILHLIAYLRSGRAE